MSIQNLLRNNMIHIKRYIHLILRNLFYKYIVII